MKPAALYSMLKLIRKEVNFYKSEVKDVKLLPHNSPLSNGIKIEEIIIYNTALKLILFCKSQKDSVQ